MSCFWFFPHDALQTVSNTAYPIPLSFWINWGIYYNLWTIWESQAPVCLTWHVIEMTHWQNKWSQKKNPGTILSYLKFFFWIEVHVVLKEFYVFYGTRGNYLHAQPFKSRCDFKFYCLKTGIRFYSHMTSHWQMLFSDIFNG